VTWFTALPVIGRHHRVAAEVGIARLRPRAVLMERLPDYGIGGRGFNPPRG
jgi:hypothetical protein